MRSRKFFRHNPMTGRLSEVIEDTQNEVARVIMWQAGMNELKIEIYGDNEIDRAIASAVTFVR